MPKREMYIMQQHAGLLLLGFGLIALLFPATQRVMQLPAIMEWALFAANTVVGLLLLRCRSRRLLDALILAAVACSAGNAVGYTISVGINTASWTYAVQIYFLTKLLGRVRADREQHRGD